MDEEQPQPELDIDIDKDDEFRVIKILRQQQILKRNKRYCYIESVAPPDARIVGEIKRDAISSKSHFTVRAYVLNSHNNCIEKCIVQCTTHCTSVG